MDKEKTLEEEYIPGKIKINYSLGLLANGILNGFVFANITFFYNQKLGAESLLLGIGWLIFLFWNTINDPIASYIIDNTRTSIGRRIPYIRYGSIFYGLAFIFCFFPIAQPEDQVGLFINFIAALFLLDTMFTFVGACFFSLPNEIAVSAQQRASLGVYGAVIGFVNLIIGLIVPVLLFTGQAGLPPYFGPSIIIIGLGSSALLFITSFFIKENMFAQLQPHEKFIEGLKLTLKNKPFWIFMIPAFFIYLVYPIFQTGFLYYVEHILVQEIIFVFIIALIFGVVIGLVLSLNKIATWRPKKTMMINLVIIVIGFAILFLIGTNSIFSPIPAFITGIGFAGAMVSNPVMLGDTIDNDELITGKRREAIYGGVNALVNKPAISISNLLFLSILEFYGFVGGAQTQSTTALLGLLVAFAAVPAILLALAALSLKWYPLDGPEWEEKKKNIYQLHKEKEKEYLKTIHKENEKRDLKGF